MRRCSAPLAIALLTGCGPAGDLADSCAVPERTGTLPAEIGESSGIAASRRHAGVFWTHNDSGGKAVLFAVDETGRVLGRVRVAGARNRDWEDLAVGPCDAGDCIYIADTGDNQLQRDDAAIYRVPEPDPDDTVTARAERFPVAYPDGPRDVEAIYVLPDQAVYLIGKGRGEPVAVYRYAPPLRAGETARLLEIQRLSAGPAPLPYQVTGAGAAPDGRWVAIRTYSAVELYRVGRKGRLSPGSDPPVRDVQVLAEPQGEAVDLLEDGTVVLTSEAGPDGVAGTIARMRCRLPGSVSLRPGG